MNLFKSEVSSSKIASPTNGEILELTKVPDEVFSKKIMGDGFAIKSYDGVITSPVDAKVEMVFETKHAIGLKTSDDLEILIHLGIDTVELNGVGFEVFVSKGDKVKVGDKLIKMDIDYILKNGKSDISPVIFTNLDNEEYVKVITGKTNIKEFDRIEILNK